jgi:hypothetical protein
VAVFPHNYVTTIVRCRHHQISSATFCLRVDREVPGRLRCNPAGGGGGSTLGGLGPCPCTRDLDVAELQRRVNEELRRGIGEWVRRGAVVIEL